MDGFRGIKARLEAMGVEEPTSRRARKRQQKATSIDLSAGTVTPEGMRVFLHLIGLDEPDPHPVVESHRARLARMLTPSEKPE